MIYFIAVACRNYYNGSTDHKLKMFFLAGLTLKYLCAKTYLQLQRETNAQNMTQRSLFITDTNDEAQPEHIYITQVC